MGRRIEVELTSTRDDGSWTWRAAGAKKPKGELSGDLLYEGAKVGDVVKAEAEFHLDGIEITEVFAPKAKKERTNLLEMKSRPLRDDELVTTQRVSRNDRGGDRRGERGRARGERRDRGQRRDRGEQRGPRPEADRRPKPKRLRPRRTHRDALLAEVTEEHRPIVEQVMRDGMPGVRAAIEKQNAEAKAAGKPEVDASPIISIAEKNLGRARLAEWRDRADAALADAAELDIRDLRSVVVAGTDVARDDETRAMVDQIKAILDQRLESDHAAWLEDLDSAVSDGRVVRGLRLSSRPVKAGAPLPTEMAGKLAEQASQALAPDVMQDRWATVLDALAFSPVRGAVTPVGLPSEPSEELLAEVRRLSDRIPAIANLFGIDPAQVPKSAKRRRSPRRDGGKGGGRGERKPAPRKDRPVPGAEPKADKPTEEQQPETPATPSAEAAPESPAVEVATEQVATAEAAPDTSTTDTSTSDTSTSDTSTTDASTTDDGPVSEAPTEQAPATDETTTAETPAEDTPVTDEGPAEVPEAPADEAPTKVPEAPAGLDAAPAGQAPAGGTAAPPAEEPATEPSNGGETDGASTPEASETETPAAG